MLIGLRYGTHPPNNYRFPYIEAEAVNQILERKKRVIGIDTLSPDRSDGGYPVHVSCLSNGILIVENVANLKEVPPTGYTIHNAPLKLQHATKSPIRMWTTYE